LTLFCDSRFNALLVEPEQPPREVWVENSRKGILSYIGGGAVMKYEQPHDAACLLFSTGPQGKCPPNRAVFGKDGGVPFIIYGPFLITGRLYGDRLCGLCPEQVVEYRRQFLVPHVFVRENNEVVLWRSNG
jgi:hypothetical protein